MLGKVGDSDEVGDVGGLASVVRLTFWRDK